MDWTKFQKKFHKSWHRGMKPFIESNDCNKIYAFLKSNKDKGTIWPSSNNTFRNFENANLNRIKVALIFEEPFSNMEPDGIPLSCDLAGRLHPVLNSFYNGLEKEFYGLNLNVLKPFNVDYLTHQNVFLHNACLTVFKDRPKSHKDLWKSFTTRTIKMLVKKNIPIVFIGKATRDKYKHLIPLIYPEFSIVDDVLKNDGSFWEVGGKLISVNEYLIEHTEYDDIMWLKIEAPF